MKETYEVEQNRAIMNLQKPTRLVELWSQKYEQIINSCGQIENELADNERRSCCSIERFRFSQKVVESTREINDHINGFNQIHISQMFVDQPTVVRQTTDYIPNLRSVEKSKKAIYEAIERCTMIGLWGMGGIGKTTLMKQIFNELVEEPKFKLVVMVIVSSNPDIKNIQDTIGCSLQKNWDDSTATHVKASRISERLKQKGSTLIIFDDVWERLELRDIGIPDKRECCCKIVLTTRILEVCNQMGAEAIKMNVLSETEAWDLFRKNADVVPEIEEIAEEVCAKCAGLPLAISVVAKALKGEVQASIWRQNLKFLEDGDPDGVPGFLTGVYTPLKLSYDRLPRKELQKAFLLCSIFPEDHPISLEELICYGIGAGEIYNNFEGKDRYDAYQNIFILLKRRGLLQDVEYDEVRLIEKSARMHDVVRDLAIYIAKEEFKGSFNQEGLKEWISSSVKDDDAPPPNVKKMTFLSLNCREEMKRFHPDFFNGMEDVLLLDLIGPYSSDPTLTTTSNIQKLKNLRTLMLKSIAVNVEDLHFLHNLSVLRLRSVNIKELNQKFSAKLVHLRVIDFTNTMIDIIRPKTFSSLEYKLEVLHMIGSFNKWQASSKEDGDLVAFVELTYLKNLYSLQVHIDDERIFSDEHSPDFVFPSVEEFNITPLGFHPNFFLTGTLQQLNNAAKWVKSLLEKIKEIQIYHWEAMCSLESPWLINLQKYRSAQILPNGPFQRLKHIRIYSCDGLRFIFSWNVAVCLMQLEELNIKNCYELEVIIRKDESDKDEDDIMSQYYSASNTNGDHNLQSTSVPILSNRPFQRLKKIWISYCDGLKFIFPWNVAVCLMQLEGLQIFNCSQLEVIIRKDEDDIISQYDSASNTNGDHNLQTTSVPILSNRPFQRLKKIWISYCNGLKFIFPWNVAVCLMQLEWLTIIDCSQLEVIIGKDESVCGFQAQVLFPKLKGMDLRKLPNLESLWQQQSPERMEMEWSSLQDLNVYKCKKLKRLFLGEKSAPMLEIFGCEKEWYDELHWEDEQAACRFHEIVVRTRNQDDDFRRKQEASRFDE